MVKELPLPCAILVLPCRSETARESEGDIRGPTKGDYSFTDWDNPEDDLPEDEIEDAPEGYYDEER